MNLEYEYDKSSIHQVYDDSRRLPRETIEQWMSEIQKHIHHIEKIIDLGCGTGRFSFILAQYFNTMVYGIDSSEKMLSVANKKLKKTRDPLVTFIHGSSEKIPLNTTVDMFFMSMVLHHILVKKQNYINEIIRLLNENSYVVIRNATKENIEELQYIDVFSGAKDLEMKRMPSRDDVKRLFMENRFSLITLTPVNQLFAGTKKEYIEKISKRGLSGLQMIPDKAFNQGIKDLKKILKQKTGDTGFYEEIDLFIFKRK